MGGFYSREELLEIGFKKVGENVLISKMAGIYGAENIEIGNNVRIDDFCILSGKITFGDFIHIGPGTCFFGAQAGIYMGDYSSASSRCGIYALTDDLSGRVMFNPMIDEKFRNVKQQHIHIGKHCGIGTNCTILPGAKLNDGVCLGVNTFIKSECEEWSLYVGSPGKKLMDRDRGALEKEKEFLKEYHERCKNGEVK